MSYQSPSRVWWYHVLSCPADILLNLHWNQMPLTFLSTCKQRGEKSSPLSGHTVGNVGSVGSRQGSLDCSSEDRRPQRACPGWKDPTQYHTAQLESSGLFVGVGSAYTDPGPLRRDSVYSCQPFHCIIWSVIPLCFRTWVQHQSFRSPQTFLDTAGWILQFDAVRRGKIVS